MLRGHEGPPDVPTHAMNDPAAPTDPIPADEATPAASAGAPALDTRPWRLRRPVLAGFVLYGCAALVLGGLGWGWLRERERGRQDGLLTKVHGIEQAGLFVGDPDRSIRVLTDEVLAQRPDEDVRRRALLLLAASYDAAKRYDDADRTYEIARGEWPAGLARGPLYVPWANMLVTAGRPERARALLAAPGATDGYGAPADVETVRQRIEAALAASAKSSAPK